MPLPRKAASSKKTPSKKTSTRKTSTRKRSSNTTAARKTSTRKTATRRPAGQGTRARAKGEWWKSKPAEGPFAKALETAVKNAPPGTPDRTIVMSALRSLPPETVREALLKADARERALFFSVIPADQIRAVISGILIGSSEQPPGEIPSPTGGPPADILTTNYTNPTMPPWVLSDPHYWNKHLTDGRTLQDWSAFGPNVFEWSPVYDRGLEFECEGGYENPLVGLTGWAYPSQNQDSLSTGDVWFTHPWWYDWEYYIAPDPQYENLLAPDFANTGIDTSKSPGDSGYVSEPDLAAATTEAQKEGLGAPFGVLGVEIDQFLVPDWFRQTVQPLDQPRTRIATFGRWIVDSGHPDFHTEIHPPLLTATANVLPPPQGVWGASERTHVEIMSRPFTVSQKFSEGNFIDHLVAEAEKVEEAILWIPRSTRMEAHPHVYTVPYSGCPLIQLFVKPPTPRSRDAIPEQTLTVKFHFTTRTNVAAVAYDASDDTVGIIIVLGPATPAGLPTKHDYNVSWDDVENYLGEGWLVALLTELDVVYDPAAIWILRRGVKTDQYDPPIAASDKDTVNVAGPLPLSQLTGAMGYAVDDTQPFPVYGCMDVYWQTAPIVVVGRG